MPRKPSRKPCNCNPFFECHCGKRWRYDPNCIDDMDITEERRTELKRQRMESDMSRERMRREGIEYDLKKEKEARKAIERELQDTKREKKDLGNRVASLEQRMAKLERVFSQIGVVKTF